MNNHHNPIKYRGFWDVPRIFLTRYKGQLFLFDCAFDEQLEDYPDTYEVFLLPDIRDDEWPQDWTTLQAKAIRSLGSVPVSRIQFDATKRQSIETSILEEITARLSVRD
jgi:hypothetical protein